MRTGVPYDVVLFLLSERLTNEFELGVPLVYNNYERYLSLINEVETLGTIKL